MNFNNCYNTYISNFRKVYIDEQTKVVYRKFFNIRTWRNH